jgi:alcohol dehydrogenase class IV
MNFEFATASRIIFGEGKRQALGGVIAEVGRRVLVVQGRDKEGRLGWLKEILADGRIEYSTVRVLSEPDISLVEEGGKEARERRCDVVLGVGGGSAIDAGKAIAALATNEAPALEYLEVVGKGKPLTETPLPFIAVPTTAGTGAEVTRNAVLSSKADGIKVSLRSAKMLPAVAVVDPELTYGVPAEITAYTGLDALTQLIEPFLCTKANPVSDALCREALPRVARNLRLAYRDGGKGYGGKGEGANREARREMALGSLFGGLALANAGLGTVHGFAAPMGGMFAAPHGAICAALLPGALAVNLRVVKERKPEKASRFDEMARLITGSGSARGEDGVKWVEELCDELKVRRLGEYGVTPGSYDLLCERAAQASSMKANPVELKREELREILERAV